MAAADGPRETMVRDMKYERKARTLVYRHLYRAIPAYLTSPTRDRGLLLRCREALEHERDAAANPQQRENLTYEIRALEAFENSLNALGMGGLNFYPAPAAAPIKNEGVSISVQPTAHIRIRRGRGVDLVGAILVDPAKGDAPKTDISQARVTDGMEHAAILIHQYVVREFPGEDPKPSADHCVVFHSFRQQRVAAPDPYRRKFRNIEAVCRRIAREWDGIEEPPAFDPASAIYR